MATILCYLAILSYAIARPTSPPNIDYTAQSADGCTAGSAVSDNPAFDTNYRSTVEIVWSCLTVIFASSWLCVHPNVTGYDATTRQRLGDRFKLFALAVFAPDIMAVFAFSQWIGCRKLHTTFRQKAVELGILLRYLALQLDEKIARTPPGSEGVLHQFWKSRSWLSFKTLAAANSRYRRDPKETSWTYTHAHFVQMGGVVIRDGDGNLGFKNPEKWGNDDLQQFFAMKLPEAAIQDKSKSGPLAKTLVTIRVLWFLIQTIARTAQGLPIALLEVASLAFIAFHLAMHVFWWDKPIDVAYPLEMRGIPDKREKSFAIQVYQLLRSLTGIGHLKALPIGLWTYSSRSRRYPRLYCFGRKDIEDESVKFRIAYNLILAVTSSSFGAVHAIGWHRSAPVERTLWRVSCLGLIIYPFIVFTIARLLRLFTDRLLPLVRRGEIRNILEDVVPGFAALLGILSGISYVGARLIILVLPFFELRDLPPLVHRTVSWSRFLSP